MTINSEGISISYRGSWESAIVPSPRRSKQSHDHVYLCYGSALLHAFIQSTFIAVICSQACHWTIEVIRLGIHFLFILYSC